jgi:apolipoprotein N-acyltransferase
MVKIYATVMIRAIPQASFPYRLLLGAAAALLLAFVNPSELFTMGFAPLGFVALIPLAIAVYKTVSFREFLIIIFIYGFINSLAANYWLFFFRDFRFLTLISTAAAVGFIAMIGLIPLFALSGKPPVNRALLFAAFWTLYEFMKSSGYFGFPWGLIAYTLHKQPFFNQIADTTGTWGLSFIFALYNAFLAECFLAAGRRPPASLRPLALLIVLVTAINIAYGLIRWHLPLRADKEINLLLVQQNLDSWQITDEESVRAHLQAALKGLNRNPGFQPDLIVSGETTLFNFYDSFADPYSLMPAELPLKTFIKNSGAYNLLGAPVRGVNGPENGVVLTDKNAEMLDTYGKRHLVPFAEGIPLGQTPFIYNFIISAIGYYPGWMPGTRDTLFTIKNHRGQTVRFTTPICFEDAFSAIARRHVLKGSELFIVPTNDSWSRRVSAETQHLIASRFRSIETRRSMARAANAGITAFIDEKGTVTQSLKPFTNDALPVSAQLYTSGFTFYTLAGDWFIIVNLIVLLQQLIAAYRNLCTKQLKLPALY